MKIEKDRILARRKAKLLSEEELLRATGATGTTSVSGTASGGDSDDCDVQNQDVPGWPP